MNNSNAPINSCKGCNNQFFGKFCNNCGEKLYTQNDKSLLHIFEEGFHFITHFEGTFFTTLKTIFTAPGKLSLDYCNGIRKKYFKPLSFFLLLVILYLLFPVFEGLNMKLKFHQSHRFYGEWATKLIHNHLQLSGISLIDFEKIFHMKAEKVSKFLLFTVIPAIAFVSWLISRKKRKMYFDHFIFSTEIFSFFILWGFLIVPLILWLASLIFNVRLIQNEGQTVIVILSTFIVYLIFAIKKFFEFKFWVKILYIFSILTILILYLENVYKFLLFIIAFYLAK